MATTEPKPSPGLAVEDLPARRSWVPSALLGLAVAALVAFPVGARVAADGQPVRPPPPVTLAPLPAGDPGPAVRELPVLATATGAPADLATVDRAGARRAAIDLLGPVRGRELAALMRPRAPPVATPEGVVGLVLGRVPPYPYRYRSLERLLRALPDRLSSRQVGLATALGAQLAVAAASGGRPNDAPVAFALLDRARAGGACAPQLDLLLVVAAQRKPVERQVRLEAQRAQRACPGDPTPGWLLGQLRFQLADPAARATYQRLQRDFPRSAAGWSGEAEVKVFQAASEPRGRAFGTRRLLREALLRLERAAALDADPGLHSGIALAQAGLGRPRDAATSQRRAIAGRPGSAPVLAPLVEYLEQGHDFAAAAAAADELRAAGRFPRGPALYPFVPEGTLDKRFGTLAAGAPRGPLSLGAGRLARLTVSLYPLPVVASEAIVGDTSFIPVFRPRRWITGSERWCPEWAARRDLLLTGDPSRARAGPAPDATRLAECGSAADAALLAAIGDLEAGDRDALRGRALEPGDAHDARQNLWRWAGELGRAEDAAREWTRAARRDPRPWLQLGEIEYLRGDHDGAIADFGTAIRRARDRSGTWTVAEADALLRRAASLIAAGRREEGIATMGQADEMASRVVALGTDPALRDDPVVEVGEGLIAPEVGSDHAKSIAYHARASVGDALREAGRVREAAESYAAARESAAALGSSEDSPDFRVERLENNEAVTDLRLGRFAAAREHARAAVAIDRLNPAFLMTAAYVEAQAGRLGEAVRLNRAALEADPTTYPAANDLGVLLARMGDEEGAVRALRRAVGSNEGYALAWFNLGVVHGRMGPLHVLASQGALARAIELDEDFRGRKAEPTLDASTYRTGLDLSRPLPPEWTFAGSQSGRPAAVAGGAAILLLTLSLGRSLVSRTGGRGFADRWLEPASRVLARVPLIGRLTAPALGIAAALAILTWTLARESGGGTATALTLLAGLALLVAAILGTRVLVARRAGAYVRQATWPPGLVFGLGAGAAGFAWVPLPAVTTPEEDVRLRRAAPAAAGLIGVALIALTAWLDVPVTRALAVAALIMAASLLTPVKPLDGAAIAKAGAAGASLAALGLGALALLGLS
ncbi:MAG TPA: tetratricopeptide repeat protein [Solirubrobacteraceae bacterium]|nr:tetratricopeptide repeat protein [Solirubrobacteraceae bacterium]